MIQQQNVNLPSRDLATQIQLGSLLSVLHAVSGASAMMPHDEEYGGAKGAAKMKEAEVAAENTIVKTLDRIDFILDDVRRWSFDTQETLEDELDKVYKSITKEHEEKVRHIQKSLSPHMVEGARLGRMTDGSFVCWIGSKDDFDNCIFGIGASPRESQECFDQVFKGEIPRSLMDWARNRFKNIREFTDEDTKLDDGRDNETDGPESGGEDPRGDSDTAWPDENGG